MLKPSEIEAKIYDTLNRVDGVYVGSQQNLFKFIRKWIKLEWYIFIVTNNKLDVDTNFKKLDYFNYIQVDKTNEKAIFQLLTRSDICIEKMYILNEKNNPVVAIDDFPEDVTFYLDNLR